MAASRRYRWQGDGSYSSARGGGRDVPGQEGFEVIGAGGFGKLGEES